MFHIFAGVQVVPDILTLILNREYVISNFDDYEYDFDKTVVENLLSTPNVVIARAKSYDDMVGEEKVFSTDLEFFKDIYEHKHEKPTIYADTNSLAVIVAKTLKFLYPNMSTDLAYTIYKLSIDKFVVFHCHLDSITRGTDLLSAEHLMEQGVKRIPKKTFVSLFKKTVFSGDATEVEEFRSQILNEISTEYQIANTLLDNKKFEDVLVRQLKNVAVNHIREVCLEYGRYDLLNIHKNCDYTDDIEEEIAKSDSLKLFMNPVIIKDRKLNVDEFEEFRLAAIEAIRFYQKHIDEYHWDLEKNVVDNYSGDYTDFLFLTDILKGDLEAKPILETMINVRENGYRGDLLYSYTPTDNINPMLLFYVYDLYKKNDERLKEFLL